MNFILQRKKLFIVFGIYVGLLITSFIYCPWSGYEEYDDGLGTAINTLPFFIKFPLKASFMGLSDVQEIGNYLSYSYSISSETNLFMVCLGLIMFAIQETISERVSEWISFGDKIEEVIGNWLLGNIIFAFSAYIWYWAGLSICKSLVGTNAYYYILLVFMLFVLPSMVCLLFKYLIFIGSCYLFIYIYNAANISGIVLFLPFMLIGVVLSFVGDLIGSRGLKFGNCLVWNLVVSVIPPLRPVVEYILGYSLDDF